MQTIKQLKREVRRLVRDEQWTRLTEILAGRRPQDLAELLNKLLPEERIEVFALIDETAQADVLAELEGLAEDEVLNSLTNNELADLVEEMDPDDAADVIAELPEERSEEVLELMEEDESRDVRELLKYEENTAGGIMTPEIVAVRESMTVAEALDSIPYIEGSEPFYYAYVVDDGHVLKGSIGLWEMLKIRNRQITMGAIAHKDVVSVPYSMDQEEVARIISRYDLLAVPVTDDGGKLLGRVTVDDVVDVLQEEASEDIFRFAGSDDSELTAMTPLHACGARLPWLLITLCTGFVTSFLFKKFLTDLSQVMVLSFFVPVVMAMGGNTGIQSSTLVVRGLALGTLEGRSMLKVLGREISAGAMMGVACAAIIGLWARYLIHISGHEDALHTPFYLAATVGISLFVAMTFAAVFGAMVPIALNRLKVDPAVASGPFVTSSNDIFALLIYYSVSLALLGLRAGTGG
ncbi:MAG: magnesium transporter [Kiritimatiellia bacterium]